MEWIKCSERLPNAGSSVIAYTIGKDMVAVIYRPDSFDYRWDGDTYGMRPDSVTHWCGWPAPPAAEEDRDG